MMVDKKAKIIGCFLFLALTCFNLTDVTTAGILINVLILETMLAWSDREARHNLWKNMKIIFAPLIALMFFSIFIHSALGYGEITDLQNFGFLLIPSLNWSPLRWSGRPRL